MSNDRYTAYFGTVSLEYMQACAVVVTSDEYG